MTTEIDENGFLKGLIATWVAEHREKNAEFFEAVEDLNVECNRFLDRRSIDLSSERDVTSAVIFARLLELFQGIIVVLERGMISAARPLFRVYLEAYFTFVAIQNDPEFVKTYLDQFHIHQRQIAKRIAKSSSQGIADLRASISKERLDDMDQLIRKKNIKGLKVRDIAIKAGLEDIYLTAYAYLSEAIHTSPYEIERHLRFNDEGSITAFEYGPSDIDTRTTLGLIGMTMADVLEKMSTVVGEDRSSLCADLKNRFQRIVDGKASEGSVL